LPSLLGLIGCKGLQLELRAILFLICSGVSQCGVKLRTMALVVLRV